MGEEKAEARYGFRWHLAAYAVVNGFLVALWVYTGSLTGEWFPWPVFPLVFWGLGLGSHYLAAYGRYPQAWVERETERILQQESDRTR